MNKSIPAFYSKSFFFSLFWITIFITDARAQLWTYDFGTGTGTYTTSGSSTSFLPVPSSGTAMVNIGSGNGSFSLVNPGTSLGSATELQSIASSNTSINKFSIYGYAPGMTSYVSFSLRITNATSGNWYFYCGSGSSFSNGSAVQSTEAFTGLKWSFDNLGNITASVQQTSGSLQMPAGTFVQDNNYVVEIYSNNSFDPLYYNKNGSNYLLNNSADIWVNGVLVIANAAKLSLPDYANIDSWMFYGETNLGNTSVFILDNVQYANDISLKTLPVKFSNIKANTVKEGTKILWENLAEQGVAKYIIEQSADGIHFSSIGEENPLLNNGLKSGYIFIDSFSFQQSEFFYRIKAIELTGKVYYSDIIHISNKRSQTEIMIYPNPLTTKKLNIELSNLPKGNYSIEVFDGLQRLQAKKSFDLSGGSFTEIMELPPNLQIGIYYLRISNKNNLIAFKTVRIE